MRELSTKQLNPKGSAGASPALSAIHYFRYTIRWRLIIWIALVWFFIVNSNAPHMIYRYFYPQVCNPHLIASCDP